MLEKLIRLNAGDLYLCGFLGGAFLLVHIVTFVVLKFFHADSSLLLSGALLPVIAGILILLYAISHVQSTFVQAIQFGQTRKRALGLTLGLITAQSAVTMALAALLAGLERFFAPTFWLWLSGFDGLVWGVGGRMIPEGSTYVEPANTLFIEDFFLAWWWYPVIALGAAAVGIIIAAVLLRFGRKGGWFLWGAWMVGLLGTQQLPWRTHTIVDWLIPLLVALVIAGLLWSLWSLLRITIKA